MAADTARVHRVRRRSGVERQRFGVQRRAIRTAWFGRFEGWLWCDLNA